MGCFDIRIEVCGPNEAIVISGVFHGNKPTMIVGGRAIVFPCIQTIQRLSLNTITIVITSPTVYTAQGVPISVTGVAQVKISSHEELLANAIEQFGNKDDEEIAFVARETLEGHQRAIMGQMTVEEIFRDRKTFSGKIAKKILKFVKVSLRFEILRIFPGRVFEACNKDLASMGIMVISYTVKEVHDDVGYLTSLGQSRTAEIHRDARVGEAKAQMESQVAEAKAEEQRLESRLKNDAEIAKFKRDFEFCKAQYDVEVNTARAEAALAEDLQSAIMRQKIIEEKTQVNVIERKQEIEVAEHEIFRVEKELEWQMEKPAEAEKFELETIAQAQKQREILEAEAESEAITMKGDAQAFAIEAKAKAEAEQMAKKADAWNEYGKAALMDMMMKMMPEVASEVAQPLANAKKITMISDNNSDIGAFKMAKEVMDIMSDIPGAVKNMTGVDIMDQMANRRS